MSVVRKTIHLAIIISMLAMMVSFVLPTSVFADALVIAPTSVNFDAQAVPAGGTQIGSQSSAVQISILNTFPGPRTINNVFISSGGTDFAVTANGCLGTTLAPNQNCVFAVVFTPTGAAGGGRVGIVTIDVVGFPDSFVSLAGTALTPNASVAPVLDFGTVGYFAASAPMTATITNTGTGSLALQTVGPATNGAFNIVADNCSNVVLGPQQTCNVSVIYEPVTGVSIPGIDDVATIPIPVSGGSPSALSIGLRGRPIWPQLVYDKNALNFGDVEVGYASAPQTVTITNNGPGPMPFGEIIVFGSSGIIVAPPFFIVQDRCSYATLNVGQSCTFSVVFVPTVPGPATGPVILDFGFNVSPFQISLNGNGTDPTSQWTLTPNNHDFGDVIAGQSRLFTFTAKNNSGQTLTGPLPAIMTRVLRSSVSRVGFGVVQVCVSEPQEQCQKSGSSLVG